MQITYLGYLLLGAGIIFFLRTDVLYLLTIFFIPFTASSVLNISFGHAVGIQPVFLIGSIWILNYSMKALVTNKNLSNIKYFLPYLIFAVCFLAVSILSILRHIVIFPYYSSILNSHQISYSPFTQLLYLLYGLIFTLFVALYNDNLQKINLTLKTILCSSAFIALWAILQYVCSHANIFYPDFIFNNSISPNAQGYKQILKSGHLKRITSVASEPSILGYFLIIPFCLLLIKKAYGSFVFGKNIDTTIFVLVFLTMVLSTSSATMLILAFILSLSFFYLLYLGRISGKMVLVLLCIVAMALAGYLFVPIINSYLGHYIFHKLSTGSGIERLDSVLKAGKVFLRNPLLGFGWGSVTSYDFAGLLLANTGILGFLCFVFFLGGLLFKLNWFNLQNRARKFLLNIEENSVLSFSFVTLFVIIVYSQISGFSYCFPIFWFLLGICLAVNNVLSNSFSRGNNKCESLGG